MENFIDQLTAKNSEYVHIVTRELVKIGKSDDEIKTILSEILPQIVAAQKERKLAKDILGTPNEFTSKYAPKTAAKGAKNTTPASDRFTNDKPVLMWLDSSLLMLGVLAVINGIMALFSKNARTYGIITLIIMSFAAGFVMYLMYRLVYKPQAEGKKVPWLRSFGPLTLAFLAWILLFMATMLLPSSINVSPAGYLVAAVGLIALALRYFLKRRYNIKSAMGTQPVRK
ncbi:DUF1129 family protein [Lactococcus insecticola]|uniref:DUF1129 domain-containing protein n=1 Tax=Pseudolactococcus insecticola TaxID=2709158 RepID=A0A6A0B4T3_9LACT|nr:DUF1129 family protein [Lactococcus insecticola]GFH40370.1 hypothetical protein Hs20B_07680 [Lactococcus insecticola]